MCIGIPACIVASDGHRAECRTHEGALRRVDLALVGPQPPGTWLLVHLDTAREVLDAGRAAAIGSALAALAAALAGQPVEGLFADLEDRSPPLPPHLRPAGAPSA